MSSSDRNRGNPPNGAPPPVGSDAYAQWLERMQRTRGRHAAITKNLYTWSSYKHWADKVKGFVGRKSRFRRPEIARINTTITRTAGIAGKPAKSVRRRDEENRVGTGDQLTLTMNRASCAAVSSPGSMTDSGEGATTTCGAGCSCNGAGCSASTLSGLQPGQ